MIESIKEFQKGQPGYEGYLNDRVAALPRTAARRRLLHSDVREMASWVDSRPLPIEAGFRAVFQLASGIAST